jgi:hypothetical protein
VLRRRQGSPTNTILKSNILSTRSSVPVKTVTAFANMLAADTKQKMTIK